MSVPFFDPDGESRRMELRLQEDLGPLFTPRPARAVEAAPGADGLVGAQGAGRAAQPSGAASTARDEQAEHLARVKRSIAPLILDVLSGWRRGGVQRFRMASLHEAVSRKAGGYVAPGSTERILRALRKSGEAHVELESRADSLYRLV